MRPKAQMGGQKEDENSSSVGTGEKVEKLQTEEVLTFTVESHGHLIHLTEHQLSIGSRR